MELKYDRQSSNKVYWRDRLMCKLYNWIPYTLGTVIGIELDAPEEKSIAITAFRNYLLSTRSVPDLNSGYKQTIGDKTYYYIEVHKPILFLSKLLPRRTFDEEVINAFTTKLETKFSDGVKLRTFACPRCNAQIKISTKLWWELSG